MLSKDALTLESFQYWVDKTGDRVWLTQPHDGGQVTTYTWAQADIEARRMAAHLKSLGLPDRSHIALLAKNSAHWIICDLAIQMAGFVTIPLYPMLSEETVEQILTHSESKLLFVGKIDGWDSMKAGVPDGMPTISLPLSTVPCDKTWDDCIASQEPIAELPNYSPDDLATIVYTSGSTGMPKGVMLSYGAFAAGGHSHHTRPNFDIDENERVLSYLPLAHVMERIIVEQVGLSAGFQIYFTEDLNTFVADLRRCKPTVFASVPRLWTKFYTGVCDKMPLKKQKRLMAIPFLGKKVKHKIKEQLGLEEVKIAVTGSAPLPQAVMDWYRKLGLELLDGYGMSENFGYSHGTTPGRARLGYVGEPLPGVEQRLSEAQEIQLKCPTTMLGYYKDEEKTKEAFSEDGWLLTGDMGEIDEQGRLKITGRVKELFKTSKGKYVAPAPIEDKLNHPAIEVSCVTGAGQGQPCVLMALGEDVAKHRDDAAWREQTTAEIDTLISDVNSKLDPHEHVQFAVIVSDSWTIDNGFLTPTMKIKRNVIENHYDPRMEEWYASKTKVIWD